MPRMKPLQDWVCDTCGEVAPLKNCAIEWISLSNGLGPRHFRVVHKTNKCYHHTREYSRADLDVEHFLGPDGLQTFLAMLSVGPILDPENKGEITPELGGFTDTIRRVQIPYYEEARLYFDDAVDDGWFSDNNEVSIFLARTCEAIIRKYEST